MEKFSIDDWHDYGRWIQPTLSASFWVYWHKTNVLSELLPEYKFEQFKYVNGHCLGYIPDQEFCALKIAEVLGSDNNFINAFEAIGEKIEADHLAVLDSDLEINSYIKELFATYQEVVGFWWLMILMGEEIQKYLIDNNYASSEQEINEKLADIRRPTLLEKQSCEVDKITRSAKDAGITSIADLENNREILKMIDDHVKKFEWFGTHHWTGEPYTRQKCIGQVIERLEKTSPKSVRPEQDIVGEPVWRLAASIVYWRTHCAEVTAKVVFESREKLNALAQAHGLSYEDLTYLSAKEILDIISGSESSPKEDFEKRKEGFGMWLEQDEERIFIGQELDDATKTIEGDDLEIKTFKGMVACKPVDTFRGKAKIILSPKDFANFSKGEILVAPETSPDFVPLMQIASGIITEAGGITSHAAIISRELNVPCIIGTKVATRVLKDGMEVEMDLATGLVTII